MKKSSGFFLRSIILAVMVMFNVLNLGCAEDSDEQEMAATVADEEVVSCSQKDGKVYAKYANGEFKEIPKGEVCFTTTALSFEEMLVSANGTETQRQGLVLDPTISLTANADGNCAPIGITSCGNPAKDTLDGDPFGGRWYCMAYKTVDGKIKMNAIPFPCDESQGQQCVKDGFYPSYGLCKTPPLCQVDADCGLCTSCVGGVCKPVPKNTACEDGHKCTLNDACDGFGSCVSGASKLCDDQNPCTVDVCDVATGDCATTNFPDNAVCDDGDKCVIGETCQAGKCVGTAVVCDDQNPCTTDSCDALTGLCKAVPVADSTKCEDEDPCTVEDACLAGVCVGKDKDCDDNNPCSTDLCDPVDGTCVHDALADGTKCLGGACIIGLCTPDGVWCAQGDDPCRQLNGNVGYWECEVLPGSAYGLWFQLQECGPINQSECSEGNGCSQPGAHEVACANGVDDDNDTFVDCLDPDCVGMPACLPPIPPETNCNDLLDNDGDGLVDCLDQDCFAAPACQQQPPVPPVPVLSIRYAGYPNPTTADTEVYLWCWGTGPGGNSPMGWTALTYSANCVNPAPGADYCAEITGGQILVNWYTADGTVLGCVSNLREKSTAKWLPGCENQTCTPVYNPGPTIAYITYAPGGANDAEMLAEDNGAGGKRWGWTKK